MRNLRTYAALAAFGIGLAALPAAGADTTCTTTLSNGTINGNLPNGSSCSLTNETVTGNVTVGTGASLTVHSATIDGNIGANHCAVVQLFNDLGPVSVRGSVEIKFCTGSRVWENGYNNITIGGNFTCSNNSSPFGSAGCSAMGGSVGGNMQVNNNTGVEGASVGANTVMGNMQVNANAGGAGGPGGLPCCEVTGNTVLGNVQVNNNTVGVSRVGGNKIGGNLACQGNASVTNGGVPNTVAGNKRGQCAGL
jgi:hypothetical protein